MDAIFQYQAFCDQLLGTYMDAIWGFSRSRHFAEEQMAAHDKPPLISYIPTEYDAKNSLPILTQKQVQQKTVHIAAADEIVDRNQPDGQNSIIIAQMVLITIFHYWEDKYRAQIADEFGLSSKNEVKADGMGEIRLIRLSLVHHNAIAKPELEKCKRFNWYMAGDQIRLTYSEMLAIKDYLLGDLYSECLVSINAARRAV